MTQLKQHTIATSEVQRSSFDLLGPRPAMAMSMAANGLLYLAPSSCALARIGRFRGRHLRHPSTVESHRSPAPLRPVVCSSSSGGGELPVPIADPRNGGWSGVFTRLNGAHAPHSLSDIVWPSLGGFMAMAAMGYADKILAPKGLSCTLGSFGAVCVLLFASPQAPSAQKYNVIVAHLGCAAVGVLALATFGPGWVARAVALAAAIAFMLYTGSIHPPAAGLPLIMVDVQKFHHLKWWYVIFPGVVGCVFLFLLQEVVQLLKEKCRF